MTTGVPIVNLPNLYANNVALTYASTTTITVGAGQVRDSTNTYDIVLDDSLTLATSYVGVNGLDAGTVAQDTWYYVYLISDTIGPNPVGGIISAVGPDVGPTMPAGYGAWRFIGVIRTNTGAATIKLFYVTGDATDRRYYWDASPQVLGNDGSDTPVQIDLDAGVPPFDNVRTLLNVLFAPAAAADTISMGGYSAAPAVVSSTVDGLTVSQQVVINAKLDTTATMYYVTTDAGDLATITVNGFEISLV